MNKIHKIIYIVMALTIIVLLVNRVSPSVSIQQNVNNMIGCQDYHYNFNVNTQVTVNFNVTRSNGEDPVGPFKTIYANGNDSTILHCGNDYIADFSAPGYQDYLINISNSGFRPVVSPIIDINLEKL